MPGMPRLLPLVAIAIGGVLAVNAVRGAPNLIGAAKSFAEGASSSKTPASPAVDPTATIGGVTPASSPTTAAPVCAPSASELAKEAGLSPAELQVLQSLGNRRGELDQREQSMDTQVQLIAAAEAKLDDRIKEMNGLKQNIQDLLGQADAQQTAETERLITVYEKMKPKDAAARMTLMDDSVRLPMAAKMKPAALALILAQMPAEDAKNLTEKLAQRVNGSQAVTSAQAALNPPPAAPPATTNAQNKSAPTQTTPTQTAANTPSATPSATTGAKDQSAQTPKLVHTAKARPRPKPKAAPKTATASNDKASAVATGDTSAKAPSSSGASTATPAPKPAGSSATPTPAPTAGKTG